MFVALIRAEKSVDKRVDYKNFSYAFRLKCIKTSKNSEQSWKIIIDFFKYNGELIGKLVKFTRNMIVKNVDKTVCDTEHNKHCQAQC